MGVELIVLTTEFCKDFIGELVKFVLIGKRAGLFFADDSRVERVTLLCLLDFPWKFED